MQFTRSKWWGGGWCILENQEISLLFSSKIGEEGGVKQSRKQLWWLFILETSLGLKLRQVCLSLLSLSSGLESTWSRIGLPLQMQASSIDGSKLRVASCTQLSTSSLTKPYMLRVNNLRMPSSQWMSGQLPTSRVQFDLVDPFFPFYSVLPSFTLFDTIWPHLTMIYHVWPQLNPMDTDWPQLTQIDPNWPAWPHVSPCAPFCSFLTL